MVQKEAKRCGIEFMGGPQGQVIRFLDYREESEQAVLIKDIEQELNITKSVASNLVKRMVQNGLVELEVSPNDKRAKYVRLTDKSRSQMKQIKSFCTIRFTRLLATDLVILSSCSISLINTACSDSSR